MDLYEREYQERITCDATIGGVKRCSVRWSVLWDEIEIAIKHPTGGWHRCRPPRGERERQEALEAVARAADRLARVARNRALDAHQRARDTALVGVARSAAREAERLGELAERLALEAAGSPVPACLAGEVR